MTRLNGLNYLSIFSPRITAVLALATLCFDAAPVIADVVSLKQVASGLNQPLFATFAPGDAERLFVVEKGGTIKILNLSTGSVNGTPFLTVPDTDSNGGEEGLLGLAFHPDYATNGKFYVNVTVNDDGGAPGTRTHIRGYTVSGNPDIANSTATELLAFNQPQSNHNGGWLGFSPKDGYLYIMTGDGGNGNDSGTGHTAGTGNAQDITDNLLGKTLRIDVDGTNGMGGNYGVPATNPFVGATGDDEIWAYGLRNPYRSSFDRQTGDLWIGDVGQNTREEIDFQSSSSTGGENYGWRLREGTIATPTGGVGGPAPAGAIEPVYDYPNAGDGAVIGGYIYRGPDPSLQGSYFFGDERQGFIRTFDPTDPNGTDIDLSFSPDVGSVDFPASFGEDFHGNLYVVDYLGEIYRFVTDTVVPGDFNGDGKVDGEDLAKWQSSYNVDDGADADNDGDSDGTDFLTWQRNFGKTAQDPPGLQSSESQPVPEPATLVLLAAGVLSFWWTRRR